MARHAPPRSPFLRRRLFKWAAAIFGVTATVALGVLVSPNDLPASEYRIPPIWTPAPPVPSLPAVPPLPLDDPAEERRIADLIRKAALREAEAHAEKERVAEAERKAAEEPPEVTEIAPPTSDTPEPSEAPGDAPRTPSAPPLPPPPPPAPAPSAPPAPAPSAPPAPEPEVRVDLAPAEVVVDLPNAGLWASHVAPQVADLKDRFGIGTVVTRPGHSPDQWHAADFMTSDQATGDALAAAALALPGVEYVIWQQRYNDGSGWEAMEDRGGATANHFDHVHISFR